MEMPVFKGCTRPACLFGVPIKPLILVCGVVFLLSFWVWLPLLVLVAPAILIMRQITKHDDQAFLQWAIRLKTGRRNANRTLWGGATSFAPCDYVSRTRFTPTQEDDKKCRQIKS